MTKYIRRLILFTYTLLLVLFWSPQVTQAAPQASQIVPVHSMIKDILRQKAATLDATDFLSSSDFLTNVGDSTYNEYALALARLGTEQGYDSYLSLLYNEISATYVKDKDARLERADDWLTTYLTILALGGDPAAITNTVTGESINLLANYTFHYTSSKTLYEQGTETVAYALMAMDSLDYIISPNSTYTRMDLVQALLAAQQENGSYSSDSYGHDTALTALVIQALAPFYNDTAVYTCKGKGTTTVRSSIKQALDFLSSKQTVNGDILNGDKATLESTSKTLQACVSVGIDPCTDTRFIKNGQTLLGGLSHYQVSDGGFCNTLIKGHESDSNDVANIHALNGLIAYYRFSHNQRSLYDMREEQSAETKQKIADLETSILAINENTDAPTITSLYQSYCSLPASDKRYVFHYEYLETAMQQKHLALTKDDFADTLNKVNKGNGYLYNIITNNELIVSKNFSNQDYDKYDTLSDSLTLKDYPTLTILYCKLINTDPDLFHLDRERKLTHKDFLSELKRKKTILETTQAKIDHINQEVEDHLIPLSSVTKKDKELIDQLLYQANSITEGDRSLILCYDALVDAQERLAPKNLLRTSSSLLFLMFLLLLSPLLFSKRNKKEKE